MEIGGGGGGIINLAGTAATRRVQSLAEARITDVPFQYIQNPSNRPSPHNFNEYDDDDDKAGGIPVIDLTEWEEEEKRESIREAIGKACKEWGAFHVTNHGVDLALLQRMRSVGRAFFEELPFQEKLQYSCDPNSPASQGYGSRMLAAPPPPPLLPPASHPHPPQKNKDNTAADILDWRDYFDHHTLPLSRRDPCRWPHFPPTYREVVGEYSDEMKVVAQKLLGLISESVGLPTSHIEHAVTDGGVGDFYQNITVSYYPPCPQPHLTLGLQSHSDMGALTLLIQDDVPGLEISKHSHWFTVPTLPHAILVLLADQTEIITNGIYKSAEHRAVTNSSRARLSVATFHDPAGSLKVSPAPELVNGSFPCKYREVWYGDYVSSWYTKGPGGKRNIDALLIDS